MSGGCGMYLWCGRIMYGGKKKVYKTNVERKDQNLCVFRCVYVFLKTFWWEKSGFSTLLLLLYNICSRYFRFYPASEWKNLSLLKKCVIFLKPAQKWHNVTFRLYRSLLKELNQSTWYDIDRYYIWSM